MIDKNNLPTLAFTLETQLHRVPYAIVRLRVSV